MPTYACFSFTSDSPRISANLPALDLLAGVVLLLLLRMSKRERRENEQREKMGKEKMNKWEKRREIVKDIKKLTSVDHSK